jgi:anti-sigma B factor antagonist
MGLWNLSAILRPRPLFAAGENFSPNIFRQTRGILARSSLAKTVINPASEDDLRIRSEQHGKESLAELSGRITIDSSPEFRASLLRLLRVPDCQRLEVNFCEVVYIDTSGIAVLVEVLKSARHLGKKVELSGLHDAPRYLLESTGLLSFFGEGPAPSHE